MGEEMDGKLCSLLSLVAAGDEGRFSDTTCGQRALFTIFIPGLIPRQRLSSSCIFLLHRFSNRIFFCRRRFLYSMSSRKECGNIVNKTL